MARERGEYTLVGVGIGPSNLSVAALAEPVSDIRAYFFDKRSSFTWHPGLLFDEGEITVSFLKDLVTLVDPTSRFSFLNFLNEKKRLYQFINANFGRVSRRELNQYLRWVCERLPGLGFGVPVEAIELKGAHLVVHAGKHALETRNVVLGTGLKPALPECARPFLGECMFHGYDYLLHEPRVAGRRIAVVGGGQTGAEIVNQLLKHPDGLPRELNWISRRNNFLPLDESPFTNELFTPGYSNYFFHLSPEKKQRIIQEMKLTSDGIITQLLEKIYRRIYELNFLEGRQDLCNLLPCRELEDVEETQTGFVLRLHDHQRDLWETVCADTVILCTGFTWQVPDFLAPILNRLSFIDGGYDLNEDFSLRWDGPPDLNLFALNAARHMRGLADPNLSLNAWRSAKVVNSIANRTVYDIDGNHQLLQWADFHRAEMTRRMECDPMNNLS